MRLLYIILICVGVSILIGSFLFYKYIYLKKYDIGKSSGSDEKIPVKRIFYGSSFTHFAEETGIKRDRLFKLNPEILKSYPKLKKEDKAEFKRNLRGRELITGFTTDVPDSLSKSVYRKEVSDFNPEMKETFPSDSDSSYQREDRSIANDRRIISRIEALELKLSKIETNNRATESIVNSFIEKEKMNSEINDIRSKLTEKELDRQKIEVQLNFYSSKVMLLDFLEQYAEAAGEFFSFARIGYNKALDLYSKIQLTDATSSSTIAQLLMKFNLNLPQSIGIWEEVVQEILANKATSNPLLLKSFKQMQTKDEKLREFKRLLNKDVFEKYASAFLILAEELSVLSRFTGRDEGIINEFEQYFSDFAKRLNNKIINIGLDFKYVPLFKNFEGFAAFTQQTNQSCSSPYKRIRDLEKNAILEIITYGFGNEKTKIILA